MPRTVKEWVGATDDSKPSKACMLRILERQGRRCAITDKEFTPKDKPDFDHIIPLWLGGKNCESNLQAILREPHKRKTAAEATVRAKVAANTAKHLLERDPPKMKSKPFPKSRSEKAAAREARAVTKLPMPERRRFYVPGDLQLLGEKARTALASARRFKGE